MTNMTKGQALFYAACQAIGVDPAAHGSQARLHECCDDIVNQGQISKWKHGKVNPSDDVLRRMEERFRFRLEHLGWRAVHEGEA